MADEQNDTLSIEFSASSDAGAASAPAPAEPARDQASAPVEPAPAAGASAPESGASDQEAPKPKRRGRKPKAAADDAPAAEEAPKSRRGRPRKKVEQPEEAAAEVSPEIAQARALAQVSQAQVVRRQRQEEDAAAEILAPDGDSASEPAPKPRRGRPRKKAAAEPASEAAVPEGLTPEMLASIPTVDPALRPHRRGRKPKAYIEAERAAAAAAAALLAQSQAAAAGEAASDAPASEARVEKPQTEASPSETPEATEQQDARPGRGRRSKAAKQQADEKAESKDKGSDKASEQAEDAQEASQQAESARDRRHASRHGEHADRQNRNDRRNNRAERNNRNNKRNGRFNNAPVEPSLSRDDLSAMKVGELRDKARELDIDIAGKKKAELVEEVYLAAARAEGFRDIEGILDITNDGFGYIRAHGYMPSRDDAFVPANLIRAARLRAGDLVAGTLRPSRANDKFPGLAKIRTINGVDPEEIRTRPKFSELTPIYPNERLKMEHGRDSITGRAIDIVSPIGKGQRGLIVSPPKAGKTTVLKHICQSIAINNPEVHLICLLVDERPEEVTDMQRSIKGDVVASTFDMPADNHTRVSELVIERAKRIVEMGGDVVVVLDSITRLARAYNLAAPASGRILSGGVDSAALYPPKRFLGAARNIENGGSLTILASALIDTGSKMDEVIFEEFKGTGNMELKLDRDLADRRIFPAIDPVASGTRNEDLLIDENMRPFVWGIRRVLANMNNTERAAASFIKGLKGTNSNEEFLIRTAKKAADHPEAL